MKKIILYGNTEFTKLMKYYIETDTNTVIEAVTVEEQYKESESFEGLPLVNFEKIELYYSPEEFEILVCIGYNQMNKIREKITNKCKEKGYEIATYIHSTATIAKNVIIGEGNIILENTLIQPNAVIGNGNLIWAKALIGHDCCMGNFNTISLMSSISGMVKIGNNCFLGNNSTIRDKIQVSDYTLVGAGTFINRNTEKYGVYVPQHNVKIEKNSLDVII